MRYCMTCGFRIRGKNHENGKHHRDAEERLQQEGEHTERAARRRRVERVREEAA